MHKQKMRVQKAFFQPLRYTEYCNFFATFLLLWMISSGDKNANFHFFGSHKGKQYGLACQDIGRTVTPYSPKVSCSIFHMMKEETLFISLSPSPDAMFFSFTLAILMNHTWKTLPPLLSHSAVLCFASECKGWDRLCPVCWCYYKKAKCMHLHYG